MLFSWTFCDSGYLCERHSCNLRCLQNSPLLGSCCLSASARSMEAAADATHGPDICLPGAVRWLRRRVIAVRRSVAAVKVIAPWLARPGLPVGDVPTLAALHQALPRQLLHCIPAPLGFRPIQRIGSGGDAGVPCQHDAGRDHAFIASYALPIEVKPCPYMSIILLQPTRRAHSRRYPASGARNGGLGQEQ